MSSPTAPTGLVVAASAGLVHAAFSAYWAAGGPWLLGTVGTAMVDRLDELRWVLFLVAAVKVAGALLPLWLHRCGWPARRLGRTACWLGAGVLVGWGGLSTVVALTVLGGLVRPDGGYDRAAMIGHAFLWDPLFLVWGLGLVSGLWVTRRRGHRA